MAGVMSIEEFENLVANPRREMSANYAIGNDGRITLTCPEGDRSWCSASPWNDNRAVTIEVSNSAYGDASGWPIGDKAYNSLIKLCADICRRNNIPKLVFTGDRSGSLTFHYM
jgi:N-acetyl-anhydromuramyl-L-alanine amidase AmpD